MDREQIKGYLQRVAAYRASGQKANEWAAANGVTVRQLASWSAHAARWQAKLDGEPLPPRKPRQAAGFIQAIVSSQPAATVRVELPGGAVVHWPLERGGELAALLREVAR